MSRTRQISAVDVKIRDRAIHEPGNSHSRGRVYPPPYTPYPRIKPGSLLKGLRFGNTQALLTSGCNTMREFCSSVQSITNDITNLLNSVEGILPLLSSYLALPPKETISIAPETPRLESTNTNNPLPPPERAPQTKSPQMPPKTPSPQQAAMPRLRPEDIQQLLENPLVKNLLNNFMQNPPPSK